MVRILITDNFELVAQGHTAKTKLNRRHVAPSPAASLEHIGGRRRGAARKDAAGCHCRAGRSDAKEIPSRCRHGFRHSLWPAPGSEDTELGVLMELEVGHGETEVYPRVQA